MRTTSIRFRLTLWYLLCLFAMLAIFGFGARFALETGTRIAVDRELAVRLEDVRDFVEQQSRVSVAKLARELQEQVQTGLGGGLVELWDSSGKLMFRAIGLSEIQIGSPDFPQVANGTTQFANVGSRESSARAAIRTFTVKDTRYTARVVEPTHQFDESLARLDRMLFAGIPFLLILAAAGGYWISGRALAPVDRLTRDAESIGAVNLSQRLAIPPANDELHRLALTLNKMLERLDNSFERLVQFTGDASHELRAPLTLIQTAAEFSLRGQRTPEELREAFRKILRETERMTVLVEDLLTLARSDAGTAGGEFATVDLSYVVGEALDAIDGAAEGKRLKLNVSLPPEPVSVRGDELALIRLVTILLDNAVKYTDEQGRIELQVTRAGSSAEISVRDSGIGIHPDELPRIWDRFWRADKVRSRNTGGAGLGLSIARSIAQHHGATLEAQSEFGSGSRFTLRMPAAANALAHSRR